jgi:hypothetical protein
MQEVWKVATGWVCCFEQFLYITTCEIPKVVTLFLYQATNISIYERLVTGIFQFVDWFYFWWYCSLNSGLSAS